MPLRIVVGTRREPKLAGVRAALDRLSSLPWPPDGVEIETVDVPSGEADTPIGDDSTIAGARRRARRALAAIGGCGIGLGLEGGVVPLSADPATAVLRNWAVAFDGAREGLGSGPSIKLPAELARAVLGGEDLAAAVDRYVEQRDVRSRQGTFGILTCDLLTRADAFALAVLTALAPWYNVHARMEGRR